MELTLIEILITIGMMILGTVATRALAFILFPANKETPVYIVYLGKVLPYAMIGFLVVYCLKNVSPIASPYGLPELFAILCIVLLHLWKKSTLLSIGVGTAIYMILVQYVFI